MRIPEWNAGKRWCSGPSASGRGGHGSGRGQVLRVVRNEQGKERLPCTAPAVQVMCRSGALILLVFLDGRRPGGSGNLRQVAKGSNGCHELRSGEAERVWVK